MAEKGKHEKFEGMVAQRAVTVGRPREELYRYWRDFRNLTFMEHLEAVTVRDDGTSHWVAKGPAGARLEWDAAITRESENERLDWEAIKGSGMVGGGSVLFKDAPGGRGTELKVLLFYDPPGGNLGSAFAKLFGGDPSQMIREDLRRFKQLMETGEIATIEGQPTGRAAQPQEGRP